MKPNRHLENLMEKLRGTPQSLVESLLDQVWTQDKHLIDQLETFAKSLPPLPPGWVYDFIPSEPHYNPETKCWKCTMEAKPIQKYINKED